MSISKWKFHSDKQMFSNVLFNSLIFKEKKMQYLTFKLHFLKILVTYFTNTFETMDDLTYLTMKLFKENQQ
jgi:hypothetical protein